MAVFARTNKLGALVGGGSALFCPPSLGGCEVQFSLGLPVTIPRAARVARRRGRIAFGGCGLGLRRTALRRGWAGRVSPRPLRLRPHFSRSEGTPARPYHGHRSPRRARPAAGSGTSGVHVLSPVFLQERLTGGAAYWTLHDHFLEQGTAAVDRLRSFHGQTSRPMRATRCWNGSTNAQAPGTAAPTGCVPAGPGPSCATAGATGRR